jgi:hypothetical protein
MIERFLHLLERAAAAIPAQYFQLPVANQEFPIFRERVYCYELYHQLRKLLETDEQLASFTLCGEVDKQAHPFIRQCMPDFLFHVPGNMKSNLIVMEVKPINADLGGIRKDMEMLSYFVSEEICYQCAVQLVYGDADRGLEPFLEEFRNSSNPKLRLFWHQRPGGPARNIPLAKRTSSRPFDGEL